MIVKSNSSTSPLILLSVIVFVGAVLYEEHRLYLRRHASDEPAGADSAGEPTSDNDTECCGMHITCEKDSLLASVSEQIEYYDDEELDRFAGKAPEDYAEDEIEEFRDVLITMKPSDIAGWARSLQLRNIALPEAVRDELLMIVAEARQNVTVS